MNPILGNIDKLFFKEEIKGEILINKIKMFLIIFFTVFVFTNIRSYGKVTISDRIALASLAVALIYSIVLFFLLKKGIYKRFIKYVSITLDLFLVAISLAGYQFNTPAIQPTIFAAARTMIFFSFIALTALRYSFAACIWAGIVAGVLYFLVTIVNLHGGSFLNPLFTKHWPNNC